MFAKIVTLLKSKAIIIVIAVFAIGGATAAFAATPAGQSAVQHLAQHPSATAAATHQATSHEPENGSHTKQQGKNCPGLAEAQNLAAQFHLSNASNSSAVQAICALHNGTFKGSTPAGTSVSTSRTYGYGEIEQLLTLAQFMASHSTTQAASGLSNANVTGFLAAALHACSSSSTMDCLKDTIPHFHSGNGNNNGSTPGKPTPTHTPTPHN